MLYKILPVVLLGFLSACSQNASHQDINERQALMKNWQTAFGTIKRMAENPASFDKATLQEQVQIIKKDESVMWTYFHEDAQGGKTHENAWTDKAGFVSAQNTFSQALTQLDQAAQTANTISDVEPALGALYESCGGCHKVFKK